MQAWCASSCLVMVRAVDVGAPAASLTGGEVAAADGKAVYGMSCAGRYAAMPPKLGDKAEFRALKNDAATASVIKVKGAMPLMGGAASNADAKAAIDHMFGQANLPPISLLI